MLFVCGEFDRLCPGGRLKEVLAEGLPDVDARVVVLEVRCMLNGLGAAVCASALLGGLRCDVCAGGCCVLSGLARVVLLEVRCAGAAWEACLGGWGDWCLGGALGGVGD